MKILFLTLLISGIASAQTPTPSPTPMPTPIKGFIDPCKLQTMSAAHGAWKAANCN